ncbi:DEAD/DEAH box helicase [Candidatus Peregrinibacteria bacterium]|nr:DEAD/DEAH box helicase [Candidatus Peregrinibacteria bacterium]MBI3816595.1 DEAD/DEAH box helicase [Candidatus Peregrinibacteria bacterium]
MPAATTTDRKKRIPRHYKPDHLSLEDWQIGLRRQDGPERSCTIKNTGEHPVYSDFTVTEKISGEQCKVAIRSREIGANFCSCQDFRTNTLGTCDHIECVWDRLRRTRGLRKIIAEGYSPSYSSLSLRYGMQRAVVLRIGKKEEQRMAALAAGVFDASGALLPLAIGRIETFLEEAQEMDPEFRCYEDAMDYILELRDAERRGRILDEQYPEGEKSAALDALVKTPLYPYQKEGVLFAARAGRSLLADDMGLGKTVQAIAAAELMSRHFGVGRVLVVCPTSLKYQWQREIETFTDRTVQVIEGDWSRRKQQWKNDAFFTIVSYNVAIHDRDVINETAPDLLLLDESQKVKNRATVTARTIKSLRSPYGILLTGTPIENRLEELHSLVEFIDPYRLGPVFRFLHTYQMTDEAGKVIGYRDLHRIKEHLASVLLRRTKKQVLQQLPERTDRTLFVPITKEQWEVHQEYAEIVSRLVARWRRQKFLHEKDRQRLMISMSCMRMACCSTFILDQSTRHDTKIDELFSTVSDALEQREEKIVIFSQWERMTRLVAQELEKRAICFVNLHGGIPAPKRRDIIDRFRADPACRVFLSTDAGGIGLNLQSASIVVNLDLPWNPAVLEQRISRVHRLGQRKPVHVITMVAKGTIEERILGLVNFKQSLFTGLLDGGESTILLNEKKFTGFMQAVEKVTEETAGSALSPDIAASENDLRQAQEKATAALVEEKSASDSPLGELLTAGMAFLEKLQMAAKPNAAASGPGAPRFSSFIEKDLRSGKSFLRIPLKDEQILDRLAAAAQGLLEALRRP